ncbi:MAG: 5-formyltetrahydrofolate cyclo-ligase [Actinobacteria bacterium]|nr:5-formyltetrahydrofolate cyclo-ligase [Actinomycetota bacterium]
MSLSKKEVRKLVQAKRKEISILEHSILSTKIAEFASRLISEKNLRTISIFLSYNKEPRTDCIVAYALQNGLEVYVPVADYKRKILYHTKLVGLAFVEIDEKGIRVPRERENLLSPEETHFDAVFCPGIAFDVSGNRVGHGEGLYDRFLVKVNQTIKVGLGFDFQIFDELESMEHDVKMDVLITQTGIIEI